MQVLRTIVVGAMVAALGCKSDYPVPDREVPNEHTMALLEFGEELFDKSCASCHAKELTEMLAGPALYGINKKRNRDWLLTWTKDGYNSISYGDSIALCLWEAWAPVVGCTYYANRHGAGAFAIPELKVDEDDTRIDAEINAIYDWIEYKTEMIGTATVESYVCDVIPENDHPINTLQYLKRNSGGWNNLQRLDSTNLVQRLELRISPEVNENSNLDLSIVFPTEGFAIPLLKVDDLYLASGTQGKSMMPWTDNPAYIAGYRSGRSSGAVIIEITDLKTPIVLETSDFSRSLSDLLAHKFE